MSAIFLSYRRDDSSGYAGRLFDNLAERFGRERVFMDIETLEPGMDFVAGIDRAIESCGAVIAMIGPNWLEARDREGRRRLDDPHDFIRLEINSALARGVRVIPVLVHNASMPPEQELPEPLRPLCRLQACEVSDNRWEFDVRRLADVLEPLVAEPRESPTAGRPVATAAVEVAEKTATPAQRSGGRPIGWLGAVAVVVLAVGGGAWWLSLPTSTEPAPPAVYEPLPSPPPAVTRSETIVTPAPPPEPHADPVLEIEPPHLEPSTPLDPLPEPSPDPRPAVEAGPVADPAPPGPSPEDLRQREIAEVMHAAGIDLAELRLTRPAGNNAFERYQRVLELEPHHEAARMGLIAITERYHGLVEDALVVGNLDSAQRYLDSARVVDPGTDWLSPLQREIDQRRRVAARTERKPERAPRPGEADREACLSACERRHQACRAEADLQTEADCLRGRAETCEQRYQSCMSDPSKMFRGQVSLESECAGVHASCRKSAAKGCAAAPQVAAERCDAQFDTCTQRCEGTE